jgi:alpha-tubulin suppressor-like RCC1 family protein
MVTAKDASDKIVTAYTGTVHFASTDPGAQVPPDYTFVTGEGSHIFTVTFLTAGNQTITVSDAAASSISGSATADVVTVTGFAAISSGYVSSCGLTTSGIAYCWGSNDLGRLGDGTTQDNAVPVAVTGGLRFSALRTGSVQACGLATDGAAYCWGSNIFSTLGTGTTSAPQTCYSSDWADEGAGYQQCSPSPLPVTGGLHFVALSDGGSSAICGLTSNGEAYCWGYGRDGELGDGTMTSSPTPLLVSGGLHFASVSTSGYHSCGLTTAGVAYCWGYNDNGELGDASTVSHIVPKPVASNLRFAALSSGADHSCALTMDGTAYCWGVNSSGQLGAGAMTYSNSPVPVSGGLRFTSLSTDTNHTCGLTTSGEAYCWGQNFDGQLGDGTTTNHDFPVRVLGGLRFVALSAGHRHTCGMTTEVTYCWGANDYWQFGDGTSTSTVVPVKAAAKP